MTADLHAASLTDKEAVLFLERIATLDWGRGTCCFCSTSPLQQHMKANDACSLADGQGGSAPLKGGIARNIPSRVMPFRMHGLKAGLGAASLTDKEAVLFLERIATLERGRGTAAPRSPEWETAFLDLIYTICSMQDSPRVRFSTLRMLGNPGAAAMFTPCREWLCHLIWQPINITKAALRSPEWETAFLDLIYTICSMQDSPRVGSPFLCSRGDYAEPSSHTKQEVTG